MKVTYCISLLSSLTFLQGFCEVVNMPLEKIEVSQLKGSKYIDDWSQGILWYYAIFTVNIQESISWCFHFEFIIFLKFLLLRRLRETKEFLYSEYMHSNKDSNIPSVIFTYISLPYGMMTVQWQEYCLWKVTNENEFCFRSMCLTLNFPQRWYQCW